MTTPSARFSSGLAQHAPRVRQSKSTGRASWSYHRGPGSANEPPILGAFALVLEPRSAYLFRDEARWRWQHSIPATKELRYSIAFRTMARS